MSKQIYQSSLNMKNSSAALHIAPQLGISNPGIRNPTGLPTVTMPSEVDVPDVNCPLI
jgi:hypothetical protein